MKVFVAGATGAIGRPLVKRLVEGGNEVTGLTRSAVRADELRGTGADAVVCDVLDADGLLRRVEAARPEIVVHQLTALPPRIDPRRIRAQLAPTNRLRTEGTRNLLEAARVSGARRFIAQSVAFAYRPDGDSLRTELAPLHDGVPRSYAEVIDAIRELERATLGAPDIEGVVLRYGFFYGPGTAYAADGSFAEDVRRRRVPLLGGGRGVFSFIHVDDAAASTVAAMTRGERGVYNIVDDDPAPVADWLPHYAEALGAPPPFRVPRWLGRLLAGPYAVYLMCEQPGASNAKAKTALDLRLRYASWREGFGELVAAVGGSAGESS